MFSVFCLTRTFKLSEILGYHCGEYEDNCLLDIAPYILVEINVSQVLNSLMMVAGSISETSSASDLLVSVSQFYLITFLKSCVAIYIKVFDFMEPEISSL